MQDAYTGLDMKSFEVKADFLEGDLASRFKEVNKGVWELRLEKPITALKAGKLTVSVKDRQGNTNRIERTFTVGSSK
jgi:hypothetical protein